MAELPKSRIVDTVYVADRAVDVSHPDVVYLVERITELERALLNTNRYLDVCREAIGASEGELLIDAIRRRLQPWSRTPSC